MSKVTTKDGKIFEAPIVEWHGENIYGYSTFKEGSYNIFSIPSHNVLYVEYSKPVKD